MRLLVTNWWEPQRRLPISLTRARALTRKLLELEGAPPNCEISVLFCEDERIRALNRDYRGLDQPTDVLSFAQEDVQGAGCSVRGANVSLTGPIPPHPAPCTL